MCGPVFFDNINVICYKCIVSLILKDTWIFTLCKYVSVLCLVLWFKYGLTKDVQSLLVTQQTCKALDQSSPCTTLKNLWLYSGIVISLSVDISCLDNTALIFVLSSTPAKNHAKCDSWVNSLHIFIFDILFELPQ